MDIRIHVEGIAGSHAIEEGEKPNALFGCVLEIDGAVLTQVTNVKTCFEEGFTYIRADLVPSTLEVVTHTGDSWDRLLNRPTEDEERETVVVREASGRAIARS